jgi:hypothetical protein
MKVLRLILEKIYWIAFLSVPLLTAYIYGTFPSQKVCNADGICFESGGAIIRGEVEFIFYFLVLLLFPMGVWQIIGRHVFARRSRGGVSGVSAQPRIVRLFGVTYWFLVALIPLLFWYMFGTFMAPHSCDFDGSCFQFYTPLSAESRVAVFIAFCMLWPLCAWKMFGLRRGEKT